MVARATYCRITADPYVDSLSELQVLLLGRLRGLAPDDARRDELSRLVYLTVSGVAAGLQNTGSVSRRRRPRSA